MKISILIPTYNRLRLVKKSVISALTQDYRNLEVILLDDGSDDGTREWAENIDDVRFRYAYYPHRGADHLAEITNDLLAMASGDCIAMLDSDDYYATPNSIKALVTRMHETGAALVFGALQLVDADGIPVHDYRGPYSLHNMRRLGLEGMDHSDLYSTLLNSNFIPANANLIEKAALDNIGGFTQLEFFPAQDYPTWLSIGADYKIAALDAVITCWRRHGGQVTSIRGVELSLGALRISEHFFGLAVARGIVEESQWPGIESARRIQIARSCWSFISSLLQQSRWSEVRHYSGLQWRYGSFILRIEAIFSFLCSLIRIDLVNPVLKVASKKGIQFS